MAAKKHAKVCAYCGTSTTSWTMDHVVCDCLWDDLPLPDAMMTVPTCDGCNSFFSRYEGRFRTVLAMMANTDAHPVVSDIINGTMARHFEKDASFSREILGSIKVTPPVNALGVYTGQLKATFGFDWKTWETVIGKIVRGTYYSDRQEPMPRDVVVQTWRGDDFWDDENVKAVIAQMSEHYSNMGGDDEVFVGKRGFAVDDPRTYWYYLLIFYRSTAVFAWTYPIEKAQRPDPSHPDQVAITKAELAREKAAKIARYRK